MTRWTALMAGAAVSLSAPAAAQDAVGDWIGTLEVGGTKLRLAVHIQRGPDGTLAGTVDSLDQGSFGIPLGSIVVEGGRLTIALPVISGSYTGEWDEAAATNYPDVLIIKDEYQFKPPRPFSPGGEFAGVVKAVGEEVTRYKIGWWTQPLNAQCFTKVKTLDCHSAPGKYGLYKQLPEHCRTQRLAERAK